MLQKGFFDLSIRMLPLILLFIGSITISYVIWEEYTPVDLWALILFLGIVSVSLFSMGYLFYTYRKEVNKDRLLLSLVKRINDLSVNISQADEALMQSKRREDIYAYIDRRFSLLHEEGRKIGDDAEAKSHFLSTMSHEIRTPLNGIVGFTKLLKDMEISNDQEEYISLIENSSHNLITIVNDVLDLSKMNAEKMLIEEVSFNLFETIDLIVAPFAQQADQKDIELGLFVEPSLPQHLIGDPIKLSQILTNLMGNAIKFTETYGKINLFVESLHTTDEVTELKFSVQDNGIGLTEKQKKSIFEAYNQATSSTSRKYGGTGLGLTISRNMVQLMGGDLEVESKENEGATFFFTLTLKQDKQHIPVNYPDFSGLSAGLALPVKSIKRQMDSNFEKYASYLGADFTVYYYEELFESDEAITLPDIMVFDHHYARLAGELELCASLECRSVLLTNGGLRSRVNPKQHHFEDVVLTPVSLVKTIRILGSAQEKTLPSQTGTSQSLSALVADDNKINCKLIKIILENLDIEVTIVSNGKEAVETVKENDYDIIFMDIQMPVMDGMEASKNILAYESKHTLKHTPVVALTANTSSGDREKYLAEGMDDYAVKPLDIEALEAIISKHCLR